MKKFNLFISLCFFSFSLIAQGKWTWMSGDNTTSQPGIYGTKGKPDTSNKPGAREGSVSWRDASNNLWLFGGYGLDAKQTGFLNDLWKYNPTTKEWTWVSGDKTVNQSGIYGTKGSPSTDNKPGARENAVSWIDASGSLWLSGGNGYGTGNFGLLNDLWRYTPSNNSWTWISGDSKPNQPAVYGAKGTEAIENKPGSRNGSVSWIDGSGNLWLFGGYGFDSRSPGYLNDLWRYNPKSKFWAWISGDNAYGQTGIYGRKGVFDKANKPASRSYSVSWMDDAGHLWLFGGYEYSAELGNYFNDLWMYDASLNQWAWISGDNTVNRPGAYGVKGKSSTDNKPGARQKSVSWKDPSGNLWLFGGEGFDTGNFGYLNDLWKYNPTTKEWEWASGDSNSNQAGIYGVKGVTSAGSKPGARFSSVSWTDSFGTIWLFGGGWDKYNEMRNDLWRYDEISLSCPSSVTAATESKSCYSVVNKIDPIITPTGGQFTTKYTLGGATTGSGSGTASGTRFSRGTTYVQYSLANDGTTNCVFAVSVTDTTPPVPDTANLPDIKGECFAAVSNKPTATDNCAGKLTGSTKDPMSYNKPGSYTINWTYSDGNGNSFTQKQQVIVRSALPPVPRVPSLSDIYGECSVSPNSIPKPSATGNCFGSVILGTTKDTLSYNNQGVYTITWTYTDSSGNSTTQKQKVIIKDTAAPVPTVSVLQDVSGSCTASVTTVPKATDKCAGPILGATKDSLYYNTQGTHIITWVYDDGNGNTSTQTQRVILKDTSAPVPKIANLPDINVQCSVEITNKPIATQNCAANIIATTNDPLTYDKQGNYTITWNYLGANGRTTRQTQKVIVKDITAPVPKADTLPDIIGECSVLVSNKPTATDNCSGTITGVTNDSLYHNQLGNYTVTWTYTDGNGNTSRQSQRVIVKASSGKPSPVVSSLPDITGECSVTVTATPTATQNCAGNITATTNDPLSYKTQGTYIITWNYLAANGSTATQTQKVIVKDITAPVPKADTLPDVIGECSVLVSNKPTATDNCSGTITGVTNDSLYHNQLGNYTVTWTYTDGNGNTSRQSQRVIVKASSGKPSPVVSSLPDITGECSVTVTTTPTATQNCAGNITATTKDPLSYKTQGTYIITWNYLAANGSTATQTQKVIVKDITAPVPKADTLPDVIGECSVLVSNKPTATDNCSGTITGVTNDSLYHNQLGNYTITWTYTDGNGNTSRQSQRVIVKASSGKPSPVVSSLPDLTGECSVTVTATPTATQNCAGNITATTSDPLFYNKQGTYVITWNYLAANGSTATQTQKVIVKDITAPVPKADTLPDVIGECSVLVSNKPTATDNCSGTITGVTNDSLYHNQLGNYTITWTYTDGNGNTSRQSQRVIVKASSGKPSPVVSSLPDITGECSVTVTATPTATQNCAGNIIATTSDPLFYNKQGTYIITWNYLAANGSTATQTQKVIVKDITAPVPKADTLPDVIGECSVLVSNKPTATDNCSGTITGVTNDSLYHNQLGNYTITWTYTDGNGNTSRQSQRVIVKASSGKPSPVVSSLPDITGECSVTVTTTPTATQNCAGNIIATTSDPLFYNKQGTYVITWNYIGTNGSTATQTQKVILKDITPPVPTVDSLPDITGECSVVVSNKPTATDNCSGIITGTTSDQLAYNLQGSYTITWTYNDGNGNLSSQKQHVIVKSGSATTPVGAALPDITAECSVVVTSIPTATFNCGGTIKATTNDPLVYNTQGSYVITWTFNQGSSNSVIQKQNVTVKDITAPIPTLSLLPDLTDECSVSVTTKPTAKDNCAGTVTATTTDPLVYGSQGNHVITWIYNDGNGNISTQKQNVIIKDKTAPVPDAAILPDIKGECTVVITNKPTAKDKCGGTIVATTSDPLVYTTQGVYTITWRFNDGNGNSTTQKQNVIVKTITLEVKAFPNPTKSQFTIIVKSCKKNEVIGLRIFDVLGRLIEKEEIKDSEPYQVGMKFSYAAYFAEVTQGKERVIVKLFKTE